MIPQTKTESSESAEIYGHTPSKGGNVGVNGAINGGLFALFSEVFVAQLDYAL